GEAAGKGSTASSVLRRFVDTVPPTVSLSSSAPAVTNGSPITVVATFSEAVTGFTAAGVGFTNATLGGFVALSSTAYQFDLVPLGQGPVTATVAARVAHDAAGNNNTAAPPLSRTFDSVPPTATLSSTTNAVTNVNPIPVAVHFNEVVTDFTSTDFSITGGTLTTGSFSGNGQDYSFSVTP